MFFSVESGNVVDVWSLLPPRERARETPEQRSDVYVKCVHGAGLKVRGGERLEVKLRSTRDSNGIELWKKVILCDKFLRLRARVQPQN